MHFFTNFLCRTVQRYLPWLFNPPGNTAQGPKEFLDCVAHIRLLSWLLLGGVNHTLKFGSNESVVCQPIPLEASCHIADHIHVRGKNMEQKLLFTTSGHFNWIRGAVEHVGSAHVLPLPRLHFVPVVDDLPGANCAIIAGQGRGADLGQLHFAGLLGKGEEEEEEDNSFPELPQSNARSQVTPGILQLVSHSKVLAEMVNLHFLSLMVTR